MQAALSMNPLQSNPYQSNDPFKSSYQENQVFTASREELVLMLYDGAMRFLNQGLAAIEKQDIPQIGYNLLRVQKIVHYLDMTLNMEEGKDVAQNLTRLYEYINRRLSEAQRNRLMEPVEDAKKVLKTLRDAWQQGVVQKAV